MLKLERWIVYPLLMLSLFSSLVGIQVIRAQQEILDRVVAKELVVVNEQGAEVFSVRPNNNGGVNLLAGQKDSEEYFEVRVLDDFLGFGLLNTSMVLQNSRDSFYVAVGSNDFDTGTTVRLSRSMYDGINYTEDTAVVLETNEDQGAVTLLRNNQKALLGVDAGGAHVDLIDFDTESVAVMGADADGPLLLLIQQEPGVVLAANSEGAGMALGLIGNDYVPYLELDGTISNGGSLYLYNAMGGTRGILSSEEGTGNGGLWLYNRTGTEYQSLTYE